MMSFGGQRFGNQFISATLSSLQVRIEILVVMIRVFIDYASLTIWSVLRPLEILCFRLKELGGIFHSCIVC